MLTRHTVNTPYPVGPVHLYAFKRRGDFVLFDTGPPTQESFDYLLKNIKLDELKYVFVTHSHADHSGGLEFVAKNTNARIFAPKKDILKNRLFDKITPYFKDVFLSLGFPKDMISHMFSVLLRFKNDTPMPECVEAVEESDLPENIEYFPFPGHSVTDYVYFIDKKYAVTGDFLLNGIFQTPLLEIDPETMELFNNYEAYCNSISNIGLLTGMVILPSHSEISSIEDTIAFYVDKILKRSVFVLNCIKRNCDVFKAVSELTNPYENPFKAFLKASEIVFFKSFVENPALLEQSLKKAGIFDRFKKDINRFI